MPTGLRREGGDRTSRDCAIVGVGGLAVLLACACLFVAVARAERPQATERVLIFSCIDNDQLTCPQQLMSRYDEWTAMHPRYFITGRQVSIGVAAHNVRGYTDGHLHTMSLSVFYINKYGD